MADRTVILNVITKFKEDRKGASGGLDVLEKQERKVGKVKKKVDDLKKNLQRARTPLLDHIEKSLNKIGFLAGRAGSRMRRFIRLIRSSGGATKILETGLKLAMNVLGHGAKLILRFAGPIVAVLTVAVSLYKSLTFWQKKGREELEKSKALEEKRLSLIERRVKLEGAIQSGRSTIISGLLGNGSGILDLRQQEARAQQAVGSAKGGVAGANAVASLSGKSGAISNQINALRELKNAQQSLGMIQRDLRLKEIEGYGKVIDMINRARAIKRREADEDRGALTTLGRLSQPVQDRVLQAQDRLRTGKGTRGDARFVESKGLGNSHTERRFRQDAQGLDSDTVRSFGTQRSGQDGLDILGANAAKFLTASKTFNEVIGKLRATSGRLADELQEVGVLLVEKLDDLDKAVEALTKMQEELRQQEQLAREAKETESAAGGGGGGRGGGGGGI